MIRVVSAGGDGSWWVPLYDVTGSVIACRTNSAAVYGVALESAVSNVVEKAGGGAIGLFVISGLLDFS